MVQPKARPYNLFQQSAEEETIRESNELDDLLNVQPKATKNLLRSKFTIFSILLNVVLLLACATVFIQTGFTHSYTSVETKGQERSFAIGSLQNEYYPLRFHFQDPPSPYRGPPSQASEQAWADLTDDKIMIVPDADLHGLNTSSRAALRDPNVDGSGILAKFEVFHALHCVNLLRKQAWSNYEAKQQNVPYSTYVHLDHCADLLRQTLQCHTDFTIHTYYRKGDQVFGDFNALHQCQNFEVATKYAEKHRWTQSSSEGFEMA